MRTSGQREMSNFFNSSCSYICYMSYICMLSMQDIYTILLNVTKPVSHVVVQFGCNCLCAICLCSFCYIESNSVRPFLKSLKWKYLKGQKKTQTWPNPIGLFTLPSTRLNYKNEIKMCVQWDFQGISCDVAWKKKKKNW